MAAKERAGVVRRDAFSVAILLTGLVILCNRHYRQQISQTAAEGFRLVLLHLQSGSVGSQT